MNKIEILKELIIMVKKKNYRCACKTSIKFDKN
jgi:hypothetical protein